MSDERAYPATRAMLIYVSASILNELADAIYADDAEMSARVSDIANRRRQWGDAVQRTPFNPDIDIIGIGETTLYKCHGAHDPREARAVFRKLNELIAIRASEAARAGIKHDEEELDILIAMIDERRDRRAVLGDRRCFQCGAVFERPSDECPECGATENYHSPM